MARRRSRRRSDGKESKWDVFDRFVDQLNDVDFSALDGAENATSLKQKRKILSEAGIEEAGDVAGAYLVSAISKAYSARKKDEVKPERVSWTDLLSYGGVGRYLVCYKDESPTNGLVVKIPNSYQALRYIELYALSGAREAQKRLGNGLAAECMVFDGRGSGKPFVFHTQEKGRLESEVAIVQKKVLPLVDYLKRVCRQGCRDEDVEEAIGYVRKLKALIISMYKQGAIDIDRFNILGNYGIRRRDNNLAIFDVGDLASSRSEARSLVNGLDHLNELLYESLQEIEKVSIDQRVSAFFERNPFTRKDFMRGKRNLFGSEFDRKKSKMEFPFSREQVYEMFVTSRYRQDR
ncbi:hypothetical protein KY361_00045 [Candidatus Woesearchaeota archaeon]|nr:hypothetical protein [Candidatus Woesearchaeota archaeon]